VQVVEVDDDAVQERAPGVELYELVRHPTALKVGGLVVNVLIVAYLVYLLRRRLNR